MLPRSATLLNELLGINPTKRDTIPAPRKLHKPPAEKIYFDAERFRWYFHKREGRTLQQWREQIDKEMRDEEAKHPETD